MSIENMLEELERRRAEAQLGEGPKYVAQQHAKAKLTARERLDLLLDEGSFRELHTFVEGAGVVTGHGKIEGRPVYAFAQDFTALGAAFSPAQADKICKILDQALEGGVPVVGLVDSVGIQKGPAGLAGCAELLHRQALASGVVPQVWAVMGPCPGDLALSPALADFVVMVEETSHMHIQAIGPEMVARVSADLEALGGAAPHSEVSGVAHFLAGDDEEAISLVRQLLGYFPQNNVEDPPYLEPTDDAWRMEGELDAIALEEPCDMREIIRRVFDRGSFLEVHQRFARDAIVGLARLYGLAVGVVAMGALDIDVADKIVRFVRTCDCFNLPLIVFVDSTGFPTDMAQEHKGIIRHGAKLVYVCSEATIPKVAVIVRRAYGGAFIATCPQADMALAWPKAEVALLGPEKMSADLKLSSYEAAAEGYVDEVIEPHRTRPRLIAALEVLKNKRALGRGRRGGRGRGGNTPL
jgi:acetyl-CoA carboxylase carboxyltransferase component